MDEFPRELAFVVGQPTLGATIMPCKWKFQWANGNFSDTSPERLHSHSVGCVMSPRDAADLEWLLSEGMQVSALPPVWIAMIIACWSVKLLKLPSVTLTHVCGTYSHNWWANGLPGVGVFNKTNKEFRIIYLKSIDITVDSTEFDTKKHFLWIILLRLRVI